MTAKLVLIADPHVGAEPRDSGFVALARAVDHIRAHHADAALAVFLGDLVETGTAAEYARLATALAPLPMPIAAVPGNHDQRPAFLACFGRKAAEGFAQATVDAGPFRVILLDSHVEGAAHGSLSGGRLAFLDRSLAAADRPCLVALHHPPMLIGVPAYDAIGLEDRAAFAAVLAAHRPKVAAILFGHCHMPIVGGIAGVPAIGLRSVSRRSLPILDAPDFAEGPLLAPSYGVVLATAEGVVLHTVDCA